MVHCLASTIEKRLFHLRPCRSNLEEECRIRLGLLQSLFLFVLSQQFAQTPNYRNSEPKQAKKYLHLQVYFTRTGGGWI